MAKGKAVMSARNDLQQLITRFAVFVDRDSCGVVSRIAIVSLSNAILPRAATYTPSSVANMSTGVSKSPAFAQ